MNNNQEQARLTAKLQRLEQFGGMLAIAHEQIRPRQLVLLTQVAEHPGLTQAELANRVGITPAAMSRNMDTLGASGRRGRETVGLGWLETKDDPADDRPNRIFITEEGQRVLALLLACLWPE